eukprot:jgi/Psemu1/327791/estExt_fgenesh1_pg.C_8240002
MPLPRTEERQKRQMPSRERTILYAIIGGLMLNDITDNAASACQLYSFLLEDEYFESDSEEGRTVKYNAESMKNYLVAGKDNPVASKLHPNLRSYDRYLKDYVAAVQNFEPVPDLMDSIVRKDEKNNNGYVADHSVCKTLRIHPDGLPGIFPIGDTNTNDNDTTNDSDNDPLLDNKDNDRHPYLSHTPRSGYVEPLLPPMRYHGFCNYRNQEHDYALMNLNYLVHDFEAMCEALKPTSKRVFIDMGASLAFHKGGRVPVVTLLKLYERFGFRFDHIYGFEMRFQEPNDVFGKLLPEEYLANYHWINIGVTSEEGHRLNPLHSILSQFNEDDFIVVKLDIDTSSIEYPLAMQILNDSKYHHLIDQFYFEHHVHLAELKPYWGYRNVKGTVHESLRLFHDMRRKGVPAHFWP